MATNIRVMLEEREHLMLRPCAAHSDQSLGRLRDEEQCDIRTVFQRDRDRIIHSKSFRRLKDKTQVFLTPDGDHYRTRMTHTLEVSQIARSISKALLLNEDLTEAIALGHDLGHTPFGHAGERALNRVCPLGFEHNKQSLRVVNILEKDGRGLNLTQEVLDGILNHQTEGHPFTLEGRVVQLADKMAYVNHDIDDAIRGQIICEEDIPSELTNVLGHSLKERLNTLVHDVVINSADKDEIVMSDRIRETFQKLREYMFEHVYTNPVAKGQEYKAERLVEQLYAYYIEDISRLPEEFGRLIASGEREERVVSDYVAGMTDKFAVMTYEELMIPKAWGVY
ncbi:MAG: deoxyguanosinetriphosphate triphosphohydrolase [Lachnospiraceae bacterium]|nr:deoxyguanosinetriphosphate triphosphohydrolase [Lachnospiraceae bacterium]MBR7021435.1 deoxyguanosinetriphosphate triphosphohydrolase [Lachnospiraceae bacterium]